MHPYWYPNKYQTETSRSEKNQAYCYVNRQATANEFNGTSCPKMFHKYIDVANDDVVR